MDNVNDLKQTTDRMIHSTQNQQPITMSAVSRAEQSASISINATNGLSGVDERNEERQVVRINPNRRKPTHRTVDQSTRIDPSEVIPEKAPVQSYTPRDKAMSELANAVARKQNEYREFIRIATADDEENRERVEAGLETVNGEMQYMPNELHVPVSEDQKINAPQYDAYGNRVDPESDDFFGEDLSDTSGFEVAPQGNVHVYNGYDSTTSDYNGGNRYYSTEEDEDVEEDHNDYYSQPSTPSEAVTEEQVYEDPEVEEAPSQKEETHEVDEPTYVPETKSVNVAAIADQLDKSSFDLDEADFDDVTEATEEQLTDEQIKELDRQAEANLRADALKKVLNAGHRINTAQFAVSNSVVSARDAMRRIPKVERTARWPLMHANRPYISSSLKGPEIAMLSAMQDMNTTDSPLNREQARIMFDHDASPYRPRTLEAWCKTIPVADIDSIFMAMYCATFVDSNYLPMVCDKSSCRHAFLTDHIPISKMIKFGDKETEDTFNRLQKTEITAECSSAYESVITVINDNFAVGIKLPSLFNILYEFNTLNEEFTMKYISIIYLMQYIDYIYMIDADNAQFHPVGWKTYPGDYAKTYKSKIATYAKIFKEFSPTDFALMTSLIQNAANRGNNEKSITFEIPAGKCPKCGSEIPAAPMAGRQILFTHQRLVDLATTPIEKS